VLDKLIILPLIPFKLNEGGCEDSLRQAKRPEALEDRLPCGVPLYCQAVLWVNYVHKKPKRTLATRCDVSYEKVTEVRNDCLNMAE
jgi:hypothetical protein